MAEIKLQEGESIENALRRFKRKVQQEDIIKDIKKHSSTSGGRRRAKQALARSAAVRSCVARVAHHPDVGRLRAGARPLSPLL